MSLLYNFVAISIYSLICLVSPFNKKAKAWINGRKGIFTKLRNEFGNNKAPVMWIHCSSLGEFEQGRDIIEKFKERNPEYKVLLSFYSPSGYNHIVGNYDYADTIIYLPLDTSGHAKNILNIVNPDLVFWIKYDYWPNILIELQKRNIPVYLVSAIFRENQLFFKSYGKAYKRILTTFKHLFVQNNESKKLLEQHGITNVSVVGDTRFDRVAKIARENVQFEIIDTFTKNSKCLILGSSWPKDEALVAEAAKRFPNVKLLVVPHEIHESHLNEIENQFSNYKHIRYTQATVSNVTEYNLILVDTMGMLSRIYKYAQVAYIGCGFDDGIHNTIEAAVYGMPVVFGPKYKKFREAVDLINLGAATSINTSEELSDIINLLFTDAKELKRQSDIAYNYVEESIGSTDKILDSIK